MARAVIVVYAPPQVQICKRLLGPSENAVAESIFDRNWFTLSQPCPSKPFAQDLGIFAAIHSPFLLANTEPHCIRSGEKHRAPLGGRAVCASRRAVVRPTHASPPFPPATLSPAQPAIPKTTSGSNSSDTDVDRDIRTHKRDSSIQKSYQLPITTTVEFRSRSQPTQQKPRLLTVAQPKIRQLRTKKKHVRPRREGVLLTNASEELHQGRPGLLGLVDEGHGVVHPDDRHRVIGLETTKKKKAGKWMAARNDSRQQLVAARGKVR